jgi:predicted RNA-binding Zn-ribbon protein involved in translation (DUF1610 family)
MTEKPDEEKIRLNKELDARAHDIAEITKRAEKAEKDLEALRKKRAKASNTTPTETDKPKPSAPGASNETEKHDKHGHEEGKPHYIGAWQHFCPTCGDPNPDFKDETVCTDCGTHLGAKDVAEKLKACPNCGGHSAKVIK